MSTISFVKKMRCKFCRRPPLAGLTSGRTTVKLRDIETFLEAKVLVGRRKAEYNTVKCA